MDGEKDVAIISEAASSGISLQVIMMKHNHFSIIHILIILFTFYLG